jgi:hypothetical protein
MLDGLYNLDHVPRMFYRDGFDGVTLLCRVGTDNELRVCAARSRRRSPVGRTRGTVGRSSGMEISTEAFDAGVQDHRSGGSVRRVGGGYRDRRQVVCPIGGIIWGKVRSVSWDHDSGTLWHASRMG